MQKVSKEYRESMKDSLRERAYIKLCFGLFNQEAQLNAKIDSGKFTYYSNVNNLFTKHDDNTVYATLEENFTKVDGSMFFLPRKTNSSVYYNTGLVGDSLVSSTQYVLTINLHTAAIDFKGLTVNFGENYPVDFDVVSSEGQTVRFRGNNTGNWSTEEVFKNTTYIKFIFYKMKNPHSRLRIYSVQFGFGLVYGNDSVISSQLDSYISPIGADIPQIDFSVTLKNYDKYFNVDNPRSAINFFETGQAMDIYYGYYLPKSKEIEWIRGNHLVCSEWESDDSTATIRCQDVFRRMDSEYSKGTYTAAGISYYDLAVDVLADVGQTNYYIDPRLKNLYTNNPLPRVKHKEALQIIANACMCTLSQSRSGQIRIESNFVPSMTARANDQASYSKVSNILSRQEKKEYASFATGYTVTDGSMYFLPRSGEASLYTGYVSNAISGADCKFSMNPIVTIVQEARCTYYGVQLTFGNALPAAFTIRTYNNGSLVEEYENEDEITRKMVILHDFRDFDTMAIEFTKTAEPYNRIVLNNFTFGDITDFIMTKKDMTSSPKTIKQELIKEVTVVTYTYRNGTQQKSLISEEVTIKNGDVKTFYVSNPSHGFSAKLKESSSGVTIAESGSYFVTVLFSVAGTYHLEISGYQYEISEQYGTLTFNTHGKSIKWENPLISDIGMELQLCFWLGKYYSSNIEYEYDTRGFPEIDVNDIVYQENEFKNNMKVNIYRQTLTFNQAFGGKVVARRQGEET